MSKNLIIGKLRAHHPYMKRLETISRKVTTASSDGGYEYQNRLELPLTSPERQEHSGD
ncbi:hypothetical protein KIN20_015218 [Parelaphostrongylus tenuis]|uniref:Uncharacterized protein n=1 Tax=Parelaphostrongylus tenuis TaxID=148309 RepID=A0AAD5MZZ8_PARTN|nr:hypothetical protein KIN20_015218 [Parelaphostrongylus tenuis]